MEEEIDEVITEKKSADELILESSMNNLIIKEIRKENNNAVETIEVNEIIIIKQQPVPVETGEDYLNDNLEPEINDINRKEEQCNNNNKPIIISDELSTESILHNDVISNNNNNNNNNNSPPHKSQEEILEEKRNNLLSMVMENRHNCDNFDFTMDIFDNEELPQDENNFNDNGTIMNMDETTIIDMDESTEFFHSEPVIVELARHSFPWDTRQYVRGCVWSPDGTCILMAVNENGMHIMELPIDLYNIEEVNASREISELTSAVYVKGHTTVYDMCWYPFMQSTDPATCCWLATRSLEPIHLWDAFSGERRCSYRGYDAADEVEPAFSVTFSIDGNRVIGGYKNTIKIFQTSVPGRDYQTIPIKSTASCICVNNSNENLLAVGSWNSMIRFYDMRDTYNKEPIDTVTNGQRCGITQMKFTADGEYLVSGSRKENKLLIWDLRILDKPLATLQRNVSTNQRIHFDISKSDNWLVSGDTSGHIHIWDFQQIIKNTGKLIEYQLENVHEDCCNGISLHPTHKILATGTGQYHAKRTIKDGIENDVCLWWYGKSIIDS